MKGILLLALCLAASAEYLYVSMDGSSTSATCSESDPCASLQQAYSVGKNASDLVMGKNASDLPPP